MSNVEFYCNVGNFNYWGQYICDTDAPYSFNWTCLVFLRFITSRRCLKIGRSRTGLLRRRVMCWTQKRWSFGAFMRLSTGPNLVHRTTTYHYPYLPRRTLRTLGRFYSRFHISFLFPFCYVEFALLNHLPFHANSMHELRLPVFIVHRSHFSNFLMAWSNELCSLFFLL